MSKSHPVSQDLIVWFSKAQRDLPWRKTNDPYAIWLCEIMMQQTRIETGTRYWHAFLTRWPKVELLAAADESEVLKAWQGLGYYSRARNLLKAARVVVAEHRGVFPSTAEALRKLPGVGPYTAAAISSICFDEPVPAVDGNVIRVVSRLFDVSEPVDAPAGRKAIDHAATALMPDMGCGDHNQAMMELGAVICKPKNPLCQACPVRVHCAGFAAGSHFDRPVKGKRITVKAVEMPMVVLTDGHHVALVQRPQPGIWAGLWTFPLAEDVPEGLGKPNGQAAPPFKHILTHRRLQLSFALRRWEGPSEGGEGAEWRWLTWEEAAEQALPRAMEKIWSDARKSAAKLYI